MGEPKKILSIEDNPANRKIIFDLLTIRGYKVIEAVDGKEGLDKLKVEIPDLVLTDIQLPVMDGLKVTKAIREDPDPRINKLPIIIVTSYAMSGDALKGQEAGCNAYLTKPYNFKLLLETVGKLVETCPPAGREDK